MPIVLTGTLDTKGSEYAWIRSQLLERGHEVVTVDAGVVGSYEGPVEYGPADVASAAGTTVEALREQGDRGAALHAMAQGAASIVEGLVSEGADGILCLGGSGGSSIAATVMHALPLGFPKLLVSTMASGDVSPYVDATDVTIMYSVTDVAGINSISRRVLGNAVGAIAGMATAYASRRDQPEDAGSRPLVAATMFGVTTEAVDAARARLTEHGYEVLVFHATGSGGRAMESLVRQNLVAGVLDLTTTELADELVGGVLSAGPDRLEAAAATGVPQVVSVGATDMVNFGPRDTVPPVFEDRNLLVHNDMVTLMRTTEDEAASLGRIIGEKLASAEGPTSVFLPLKGVSAVDVDGGPFWDPDADRACFDALRDAVRDSGVEVVEHDREINDEAFATAMADRLHEMIEKGER